jgi:hypothetical protein
MFCKHCGIELTNDSKYCPKCGTKTDVNTMTSTSSKRKDNKFRNELTELNRLIIQQKSNPLSLGVDNDIKQLLIKLVENERTARSIIKDYLKIFKSDIIEDLKSLSNSYDNIKNYLSPFIELNIVNGAFPHNYISSEQREPARKVDKIEQNKAQQQTSGAFNGCLIAIGAFVLIGIISLVVMPADDTPINDSNQTENWYEGGTLHKAKISEWKRASDNNRLATCADFAARINNKISMDELLIRSVELKTCIDTAIDGIEGVEETKSMDVAEIAVSCMMMLGHK